METVSASYIFEPFAAKYTLDIMEGAKSDDDYDVQQYFVTSENAYVGKNYGFLFNDVKQRTNALPIGIYKKSVKEIIHTIKLIFGISPGFYKFQTVFLTVLLYIIRGI